MPASSLWPILFKLRLLSDISSTRGAVSTKVTQSCIRVALDTTKNGIGWRRESLRKNSPVKWRNCTMFYQFWIRSDNELFFR
ncbi:hypothetical protein HDG40_007332 [Paraburkholderia sp. JPY158]|uniref:Uncharacterized protein n=1 Tax=Paraburkholderia atlantica TaxID=2654982 RepID=A0A7W8QEV1_PARAM|nr:hypothetical protein [Paraburkholderia atlantica]